MSEHYISNRTQGTNIYTSAGTKKSTTGVYIEAPDKNFVQKTTQTAVFVGKEPQDKYLLKEKYLEEFKTEAEKAKVRANLGIADACNLEWRNIFGSPDDNPDLKYRFDLINNTIQSKLTPESIKIENTTLLEVLGVNNQTTTSTNAVAPYLQIYNSISNTYTQTETYSVEYGTRILSNNENVRVKMVYGSSAGIDFHGLDPMITITLGENTDVYTTQIDDASNPIGKMYTARTNKPYTLGADDLITIEFSDAEGNTTFETAVGEKTVTRTTNLNIVAEHLLTAQHRPYVIAGPEVVVTLEDYPSTTVHRKLTFTPFKYMYFQRTENKVPLSSYGGSVGKQGYLARRLENKSAWTINNTTSLLLYYTVLVPANLTVSSFYTTFLGNNSEVAFSLLGTVEMHGASTSVMAQYKVYQSDRPVAFGDGTMTLTFS